MRLASPDLGGLHTEQKVYLLRLAPRPRDTNSRLARLVLPDCFSSGRGVSERQHAPHVEARLFPQLRRALNRKTGKGSGSRTSSHASEDTQFALIFASAAPFLG